MEQIYLSDLTDLQWELLQKLDFVKPCGRGRPPLNRRLVINAIFYLVRTGCQWRLLPKDFPNWRSVYTVFRRWKITGVWKQIHDTLREQVRMSEGKEPQPTVAIVDSQSVDTAEGGEERGYDAGKKVTGRKRHIAVDSLGLLLMVVVHAANLQDYDGAAFVLARMKNVFTKIKVVFADSAYGRMGLPDWVKGFCGWVLQTVLRPAGAQGFVTLPKRWIVERTFAWLARYRRHSRDYEHKTDTSEAMIYISMINLMSRRLANAQIHRSK